MKTDRFQNGTVDKAKEDGAQRLRVSGRASRAGVGRCETPARPPQRVRRPREAASVTTITARVDVGFGNTLFIRGEGDGLSWDQGRPLVCVDGSTWVWSSRDAHRLIRFKLLVNDQLWCRGENFEVAPGAEVEVTPSF